MGASRSAHWGRGGGGAPGDRRREVATISTDEPFRRTLLVRRGRSRVASHTGRVRVLIATFEPPGVVAAYTAWFVRPRDTIVGLGDDVFPMKKVTGADGDPHRRSRRWSARRSRPITSPCGSTRAPLRSS